MKRHLFLLSVIVGTLVSICSCTLPNGVSIGSGGTASIHFDKISLKYDFSKKFQTNFIQDDYDEFKRTHNITTDSDFAGEIDNLNDILWMVDAIPEESRKPSITLTMNCSDTTIVKNIGQFDISAWDIYNIPNRSDVYTGTVEVKSVKTFMYGLQVVWRKTASGPNWPISEFVQNGTVSGTAPGIIKVGTNNGNKNVAIRAGHILKNTADLNYFAEDIRESDNVYTEDTNPVYSPDLCKDIYIDGKTTNEVEWSKPAIYKSL